MSRATANAPGHGHDEFLVPENLYSLREIQRRTRLGAAALRTLKRRGGLKFLRVGPGYFARGSAVIEAIERVAEASEI